MKTLKPEWWLQERYTEYKAWSEAKGIIPLTYAVWLSYTEYVTA